MWQLGGIAFFATILSIWSWDYFVVHYQGGHHTNLDISSMRNATELARTIGSFIMHTASLEFVSGTAICAYQEVVCLDSMCTEQGTRDGCSLTRTQAELDLVICVAWAIFILFLGCLQEGSISRFDDAHQTAQDYSVCVLDPDPDALDPGEWKEFFEKFGHVTYVTIAKDNHALLKKCAERRKLMAKLFTQDSKMVMRIPANDPEDEFADAAPWCKCCSAVPLSSL